MQSKSRSRDNSCTSERNGGAFVEPCKRLFISGFNSEVSDFTLRTLFEKEGDLRDFFIKRPETGNPFGFVEMNSLDEAAEVISKLNGTRVGERMLWIKYAKPKAPREGGQGRPSNNQGRGGDNFRGPREHQDRQREEGGNRRFEEGRNNRGGERQQDNRSRFNNNDRHNNGGHDGSGGRGFGGNNGPRRDNPTRGEPSFRPNEPEHKREHAGKAASNNDDLDY